MSKPNDGGPAFPVPPDSFGPSGETASPFYGMSLRQHYAGLAMQGQLANSHAMKNLSDEHPDDFSEVFANKCAKLADHLIAELEKETP